jgi:CheY-like chemotaxis protein
VESESGKGSVFRVYLPSAEGSRRSLFYESEVLPSGDERILLVDDEDYIARMVGRMLEKLGYSVTTRTSSVAALELFRSGPDDFDLVFTDMTMPNMTGERLAGELRKIRPDLPVILCTGFNKKIASRTAKDLRVKALLKKPFEKETLAKLVRKVLDEAKGSGRNLG